MTDVQTKEVFVDNDVEDEGINALTSFNAIMSVVNRHRPYEPSDFVKEYYIPNI